MSIQSNINQSMSLLAFGMSQIPAIQEASKRRAQMRQAEKLSEKYEALAEHGKDPETIGEAKAQLHIARVGKEAGEARLALDPTERNVKELAMYEQDISDLSRDVERFGKREAESELRAQEKLAAEQARLARSRDITRAITEGVYLSPDSQKYVNKKLGG